MKAWQIGVVAYGVIYFILACSMEAENIQQSYPWAYVVPSMVAQTLVVLGVFLFGLEASTEFAKVWRWLFPLLVVELAAGIVFDVTIPPEAMRADWSDEVFSLWFVAPAYYCNFRIARYTG